ncbi:MAG: Flp pilus assembly complex ATPase component TadA [Burkholderiales bacterium]|nr:Flp pilus assembly complex ATPase component TadA [Burkholderiales bacterium]MDE2276765.1 Flp pilus assembly complex ATPase component TadA [Burkholderiales bacterium]
MSDLSQPALAVLPDEAATFAWPTPDLAGYPAPGPLGRHPACRIEGLNGRTIEGQLLRFDPVPGLLQVRTAGVAKPVSLRFDQFRRLCLLDPVPALEAPGDARDLAGERPQMPFRVEFGNGNLWEGRTVGRREEPSGLFLFEPLDERGTVRRWFVPRPAYVEAEVGLRIGEALIAQRSATPDQIASALAEQDALRTRKLGDLLLERHIITAAELGLAIDHQARMPMVRIGEALTGLGLITEAQLQEALALQRQDRGVPLGELLVRRGAVTQADLQTALARKMGYPLVDVLQFPADAEAVARLPYAVASRLPALPLLLRGGRLVVAVEDPSNRARLDELEFAAQCKVVPVLARSGVLQAAVDRAYEKIGAASFALRLPGDPATPIDYEMGNASKLLASMESGADPRPDEDDGSVIEQSDNTLVRLINSMIVEAHTQGVSDIHIECTGGREKVRIRFRKDGQLRPYLELPPSYRSAIIARLKIMCDLDISERRKPQDGKINFAKFVQGVRLELRVATIPTQNNLEDAVLRLLASNRPIPLDQLGLAPAILERVREAAQRPHGLLLCVGPTGSGKTTTLHSVLSSINTAERKLWTAEDPIEITQQGLRQVQVNPRIDWTFAKALRAFLRADPDVIMVGEIRDQETAQVAIEASLTGHLVLSTLHTNSAPETVTRLLDMGMDPFNFADALLGVLAQRLVRRLCKQCRSETDASPEEEDELLQDYLHAMSGADNPPGADAVRADWRARFGRQVAADGTRSGPLARYRCAGCEQCGGSGYRGRAAIHELMMVSRGLRHLIQTNSRADDLERHALGEGLRTLRQDGIEKVLAGVTSIEEVRANS